MIALAAFVLNVPATSLTLPVCERSVGYANNEECQVDLYKVIEKPIQRR